MAAPSFWEDNRRAQELIRERAELARTVTGVAELSRQAADLGVLLEWAAESDDAGLDDEIGGGVTRLRQQLEEFELTLLLSGPHDGKPAVLIADLPQAENETFQLKRYGLYALKHAHNVGIVFKDFRVPASNLLVPTKGDGLTIVFNEVRGSIASIELGAVGFLHVRTQDANKPRKREARTTPKPEPGDAAAAPVATDPGEPAPPRNEPKIDLYTTEISGPVQLTVGTEAPQSVSADKLFIWARLIDGELPPDAIAELRSSTKPKPEATRVASPTQPGADAKPAGAPSDAAAPPTLRQRLLDLRVKGPGGIEPLTPIASDDALLTWGGKLVAVAVETTPPELDTEHVAGRFVGVGLVTRRSR